MSRHSATTTAPLPTVRAARARRRLLPALGLAVTALGVVLGVGLTGTTSAPAPAAPEAVAAAPSSPTTPPPAVGAPITPGAGTLAASAPVRVRIPSIGSDSRPGGRIQRVGVNADRSIEVPDVREPARVGWYRYRPTPGQRGTAVVLGHIDGGGKPGVYARLADVRDGATVLVDRADGSRLAFRVYRVERVDKGAFPTQRVYGQAPRPELRVISCGGAFVGGERGYADNVVVYAALDRVEVAP